MAKPSSRIRNIRGLGHGLGSSPAGPLA
jgi:hypothetical protein